MCLLPHRFHISQTAGCFLESRNLYNPQIIPKVKTKSVRIYAGLCIGLMASYHFQSLTETAPYAQAKREIMHRRLSDKMQEKCKEEFVLSISVGALIYSQKTSILLRLQLEEEAKPFTL